MSRSPVAITVLGQRSFGPNQRFASIRVPSTPAPYNGSSAIDIITQVAKGVS